MAFIGSGSAKLILFGEHAVVHGPPAVGKSLPGGLLEFESDIPVSAGLGSSGVDTGLALWQRLCLFTPQPEALPSISFLPSTGIHLVFGTVPREASCATKVAAIGKAMAAGDTGVSALLAVLGHLSSQAAVLLACPDSHTATRIQAAVIEEACRLGIPGEAFTGVITI